MKQFALEVVKRLRDAGHTALWAGGCVRDMLLGAEPHDYDVASDASPQQVQHVFRRTIAIGAQFGVIEVLGGAPGLHVQVATFRSDGHYSDGRHPDSVRYGNPEEDARRRDFTINGLFFDPVQEQVIDYVGGQADLAGKLVRAIGDPEARIQEDKLRMLRAIRFVSRLGFSLDPATADAIAARHVEIKQVSTERITEELKKMLTHRRRVQAVEELCRLQLLGTLLPAYQSVHRPGLMFSHLPGMVSFPLAWATLLLDMQQACYPDTPLTVYQMQTTYGSGFRLSQAEIQHAQYLTQALCRVRDAQQLAWAELKPILANPHREDLLTLFKAGCAGYGWSQEGLSYVLERLAHWSDVDLEPPVLVTGQDVAALGLSPGPAFKELLSTIRTGQLNEEIATREAALLRLKELAATIDHTRR